MGHRVLITVSRGDGRYDLRESRWGGEDLATPDPGATEPLATVAAEHDRQDGPVNYPTLVSWNPPLAP